MKKVLLSMFAIGLISGSLNAKTEIVNLRIMDEYYIEDNLCIVRGMSESDFVYSFVNKKGSKECDGIKKLNLKGGTTYKMQVKVNLNDCGEESCSAKLIQIIK